MSFLDRIFNRNQPEDDRDPEPSITLAGDCELAPIEETITRTVVVAAGERAASFADALIPAAANAAQAAQSYGMAVVKFPEGVGWADLCVRKSDGWNLLSNMKNGKFNEMAAIKQAGLQPAVVANLALQGAAVLVGQAYMTQINDKLEGISEGVAEIQRAMERSRECRLKARFDALERVALMFDESGADSDKRTVALQAIEDATVEAQDACHYEADAMRGIASKTAKGRMSRADVERAIGGLRRSEAHAAAAFQLLVAAREIGMRLECDYTGERIEKELSMVGKASKELTSARNAAREQVERRISSLKGAPLALADPVEANEGAKGAAAAFDAVRRQASRISPVRARSAAKDNLAAEKADLRDAMGSENVVRAIAERTESELETLRFAFNEADAIVIDGDVIRAVSTRAGEKDEG